MNLLVSILAGCVRLCLAMCFLAVFATSGFAQKTEARGKSISGGAPLAGQKRHPRAPALSGSDLVKRALDAMGGEARLRSVKSLGIEAIGHLNLLEQSERPAGPWVVMYEQVTELRDLERSGVRRTVSSKSIVSGQDWS